MFHIGREKRPAADFTLRDADNVAPIAADGTYVIEIHRPMIRQPEQFNVLGNSQVSRTSRRSKRHQPRRIDLRKLRRRLEHPVDMARAVRQLVTQEHGPQLMA